MLKRTALALVGLCLAATLVILAALSVVPLLVPIVALALLQAANTTVMRGYLDSQGKGSWANIQIGYTVVLLNHLWPRDHHRCAWLNLFIAAPSRSLSRDAGYERAHWGIWIMPAISRGRPGMYRSLFRLGYSWRADRSWCVPPKWMQYA